MRPRRFWICAAIWREIQATATGSAMTRLTETAVIPACSAMSLMDPTLLRRASATLISAVPGMNAWTSRSSTAVARFHASTRGGVHVRTLGRSFSRPGGGNFRADVPLADDSFVEPEVEASVVIWGERKDENAFDSDALEWVVYRRPDGTVEVLSFPLGEVPEVKRPRIALAISDILDPPMLVQPTENVDGVADVQRLPGKVQEEVDAGVNPTVEQLSFWAKRRWLGKGCYLGPG